MRLPDSLRPWSAWLELFPEDLALTLGDWVARLTPALGSMRRAARPQSGEPDGYRGLIRRGPYERLVAAEWALADVLPEEFTRRAAQGEHLFLELSSAEPAGSLRSVALLDGGPSQLGGPRLVQIAALIALARRAEAAGASFLWGALQKPEAELIEGVSRENLEQLLHGRSLQESSAEMLAAWDEKLGPPTQSDDRWLVGRPGLTEFGPKAGRAFVELEDLYELERDGVRAVIRRGSDAAREMELDLPDPRSSARLLRDPFRAAVTPLQFKKDALSPSTNLVFSTVETRVIARIEDGRGRGVVAYSIPHGPKESPGKTKTLMAESDEWITAAGFWQKRFLVVAATADEVVIYGYGAQGSNGRIETRLPRHLFPDLDPGAPGSDLMPCFLRRSPRPRGVFFLDGNQQMYCVSTEPKLEVLRVAQDVQMFSAQADSNREFKFIRLQNNPEGGVNSLLRFGVEATGDYFERVDSAYAPMVFFGPGPGQGSKEPRLLAQCIEHQSWMIRDLEQLKTQGSETFIDITDGGQVLGATWAKESDWQGPALVVLNPDRRTVQLEGPGAVKVIRRSSSEVTAAIVGQRERKIAFLNSSGELIVYSLDDQSVLLQVVPGDSP